MWGLPGMPLRATDLSADVPPPMKQPRQGQHLTSDTLLEHIELPSVVPEDSQWLSTQRQFEFVTDNENLAKLLTGQAVPDAPHDTEIEACIEIIRSFLDLGWCPRQCVCEPVVWRPRKHNTLADAIANHCMDEGANYLKWNSSLLTRLKETSCCLQIHSDGGARRSSHIGATGISIILWYQDSDDAWKRELFLVQGRYYDFNCTSFYTELQAIKQAFELIYKWFKIGAC